MPLPPWDLARDGTDAVAPARVTVPLGTLAGCADGVIAVAKGRAEPQGISNAVLFPVPDESRCITDVQLPVDGGSLLK